MHFFSRRNASLALSLAAVGVLAACGDDVTVPVAPPPAVVVSITPQAVSLNPGASATLSVQISGGDPTPTLQSCTSGSATVATAAVSGSNCTVTAVAPGNTTITATTTGGQSASAAVTVNSLPAALGQLTVSPATANLVGGQTVQLVPNANAAGSGVTVATTYASSNNAIASVNAQGLVTAGTPGVATITVTATGTGAGFASATRTFGVTINVVAAPAGISSLTATPATLSVATSGTAQIAASVQQPTGAPAATITFGTTNPAVATVAADASNASVATVTGVSQGTATITVTASAPAASGFSASTLTQLIPVTVAPSAQVAVGNITIGQTNNPVDITNVFDQIQVQLNITTNGQNVQSAQVWVCEPNEAVPACAARTNGIPAAQQTFSSAGANDGSINTFINTAEFTVTPDFSSAETRFKNGQKVIVSTLTVAGQGAIASNNLAILNFNNADGFAARHTPPARSQINAANSTTFFGGPGVEGRGTISVVPVIYTANRSIIRLTAGVTGGCGGTLTFVDGTDARPWTYTYGYSVQTTGTGAEQTAANLNAKNIVCNNQSSPLPDPTNANVGPRVTASIDNAQTGGPDAADATFFRQTTSTTPQVLRPARIRVDYAGPATTVPDIRRARPAVTGWVNASFNFNSNTAASSDAGVGLPTTQARSWFYNGCSMTAAAMATATGADINECGTDFTGGWDSGNSTTRGPYEAYYTEADILGNQSTSADSDPFGVDRTAPVIRFSTATVADTAVLDALGGFALQAEFLDERGGFVDAQDNGAPVRSPATGFPATIQTGTVITVTATGTQYAVDRAQTHNLVHAAGFLPLANFATRSQCLLPNPAAGGLPLWAQTGTISTGATNILFPAATFLSNPGCTLRNARTLQGGPLGDGYRTGEPIEVPAQGIFKYETRVVDRAGNTSPILARTFGYDNVEPTKGSINAPLSIASGGNASFTMVAEDDVEVRASTLALTYAKFGNAVGGEVASVGATDTLVYPQTLIDARFNDVINSPVQQSLTTPFGAPFVTTVEFTTGANAVNAATPALGKANSVNALVWDWFGRSNTANLAASPILGTSVPNGTTFSAWLALAAQASVQFTSFSVLPSRDAGFNAGVGLKAQVVANTNSINAPFTRVDFYRRSTVDVNQLQYLGSVTTAIPADGGATRYWTYLLPDNSYAALPSNFGTRQANVTAADEVIAIGVRSTGEGLITQATVINAPAVALTIAGLPVGTPTPATFVNLSGPVGVTYDVASSGTFTFTGAGNVTITAANVTINGTTYIPAVAVQNIAVAAAAAPTAATVTYAPAP